LLEALYQIGADSSGPRILFIDFSTHSHNFKLFHCMKLYFV